VSIRGENQTHGPTSVAVDGIRVYSLSRASSASGSVAAEAHAGAKCVNRRLSRPRPLIYSESVERHMGISEFLEGQNLTHRQMGAVMIGWILLVSLVAVGLLLYTSTL